MTDEDLFFFLNWMNKWKKQLKKIDKKKKEEKD